MRQLRWVASNAVMWGLVWLGYIEQVDGARNAVVFLMWIFAVMTFFSAMSDDIVRSMQAKGFALPAMLDALHDLVLIGFLAWHGAWWTAVAATILMLCCQGLRRELKPATAGVKGDANG